MALLRRAFKLPSARCHWRRAPWPLFAGGVPWLIRPTPSRLLRVARLQLLIPAAVVAFADQVPRGQRAGHQLYPLDTASGSWSLGTSGRRMGSHNASLSDESSPMR